jgi:hypothetical protein
MDRNSKFFTAAILPKPKRIGAIAVVYNSGIINHCSACGQSHWHVGRMTAECAHCHTAILLASGRTQQFEPTFYCRSSSTAMAL